MKKIWFDITNTPQVHFLSAIHKALKDKTDFGFIFTARDFSETVKLLERKIDLPFHVIGKHHGKRAIKKIGGVLHRFKELSSFAPQFDVSISCGSETAVWTSFLQKKLSIAFGDNDQARQWTYGCFVNFAFFPEAIPARILHRQFITPSKLYQYPGYKEDIYLADYQPAIDFLQSLPFERYVVVRPENIMANYIRNKNVKSITPKLLSLLNAKGFHVLYLPRYEIDRSYANGLRNIYIPDTPINGLDACFYSDGVFTGAGTFAREASCLGVPSFSFYAGKEILSVDKQMISNGWMYFSREPEDLVGKMICSNKRSVNLSRCKMVRDEIIDKLIHIIKQNI